MHGRPDYPQILMPRFPCVLLLILLVLPSCNTARKFLKAKPAELSAFVERPAEMQRQPIKTAFQYVWRSSDRSAHAKARPLTELYIAPVSLKYLRPLKTGLTKFAESLGTDYSQSAPQQAYELRHQFALALANSPNPRYRLVLHPTPHSLTLEMAITELNPTRPKTNAVKLAAKIVLGPIGTVGGLAVKSSGNIAIEGKIRLSQTKQTLFQFADNESDKLTFYSVRDFRPYGHVAVAIKEWARQFTELCSKSPGAQIKDATCWTLSPL